MLSVGGLRQQFSLPENIQMSVFGAEFLRTLKKKFGQDADVFFTPNGYLMLASEEGASQLIDNSKLQKELGAVNVILGKEALKQRYFLFQKFFTKIFAYLKFYLDFLG